MRRVRLSAEGLDTVDLNDPSDGLVNTSIEVSSPAARDVAYDRAADDGNVDHTSYVGARAITVAVDLRTRPHTRQDLVDRLAPFMHPARRLWIHYGSRRIWVRPVDSPLAWQNPASVPLAWQFRTVGAPWWLGEDRTIDLAPLPPPPGRTYPLTFDRTYPATTSTTADLFNAGSHEADWTWTIEGPARRPMLRNETTGEVVSLKGLDLLEGQTAVVTRATRTVLVDGARRFGAVDQAATTWWPIPRGQSSVTMPVAAGSGTGTLAYSDTYIA